MKKLNYLLAFALAIVMSLCAVKSHAQPCDNCKTEKNNQKQPATTAPLILFTPVPIGMTDSRVVYIKEIPDVNLRMKFDAFIYTLGADGSLVETPVSVKIDPLHYPANWKKAFGGTYPKAISVDVEMSGVKMSDGSVTGVAKFIY